jgi:hypothetical protein
MPGLKLEQNAWLRGRQSFEVRENEDVVRVSVKRKGNLNEYQVPLNIFLPEPNRHKHFNYAGFGCMVVVGCLSLLVIVLGLFRDSAFFMMLVIFIPLFFVGFMQFRKFSVDAQIFRSRVNGQNALVIWRNLPTEDDFEQFMKSFQEKLRKVEVPIAGATSQSVADEIRKLGELKKDSLISEKEFEEAKARLLGSLERKEIGFR